MKLRLVYRQGKFLLLCPNGSIMVADKKVLSRLLTSFAHPNSFKGTDGCWNSLVADMDKAAGETVAFVDDNRRLIILSESIFGEKDVSQYISATEYADLHGKCRASVKNMCVDGRIPGAYKASTGWLIPKDAPYPKRKPRKTKAQMENEKNKK